MVMLNSHGQPRAGGNQPWGLARGTHSFIFNRKYLHNDNRQQAGTDSGQVTCLLAN